MKLMSMKQYSKMTKASLVRKIMKALKKLPKMKLAKLCYELEKKRLPTISTTKKGMPRLSARRAFTKNPLDDNMTVDEFRSWHKARYPLKTHKRVMKGFTSKRKKPRSAKQRANDKRLGLMAKRRAKARRRYPTLSEVGFKGFRKGFP